MSKTPHACPNCGNLPDAQGGKPIFICNSHREADTESIVTRFECWAWVCAGNCPTSRTTSAAPPSLPCK